jgi:hypothetical protein
MSNRTIGKKRISRFVTWVGVLTALALIAASAMAAETGKGSEIGKFQVVNGADDKAYLVDTTTGAVWVLTYRTIATGREPIAIPYKFIRSTPSNQGEFLLESIGPTSTLPYSGK